MAASAIPSIPVAFTTSAVGFDLYHQYEAGSAPRVTLNVQSIGIRTGDYNVIADSKGGNPNSVVVVDAHLDAIYGAGMLDNASGSSTILDVAQMMRKVNPLHKLRFIWLGGEELGLLGSSFYVDNLSPTDLGHIFYDLDADVTATPNYIIGVLDPAAVDLFGRTVSTTSCSAPSPSSPCFPANVYGPSLISRDQVRQPQQQRPQRADVHVQGIRQHRRADGVRQEFGGVMRNADQALEGEAEAGNRDGRRPAVHPVTTTSRRRRAAAARRRCRLGASQASGRIAGVSSSGGGRRQRAPCRQARETPARPTEERSRGSTGSRPSR